MSLLMKEGYERHGEGLILVTCSHPFKEYSGRRRVEDRRSITLSYVPEGEPVRRLQEQVLGNHQPREDDDGPGWLETSIGCNDFFTQQCATGGIGDLSNGRCCVIAMEQQGVKFVHTVHFVSYMSLDHPAHDWFCHIRRNSTGKITLNWDWDPTILASDGCEDDALQWLYYNAIGPNFFRECSMAWQENKRKCKDNPDNYSPWPGGVLTPPLALGIQLQVLPKPVDRLV
mmetsp:Transcript_13197/g.22612  ORF Transcript_13197/g.22612 Transcript_13197/m.22612 type:complete len:229 (+) Transcript_13197:380-1066(+)